MQQDLFTHLTEVFNRILMHHPNDAYDKFEDISALVKKTNFKIKDPEFDHVVNEKAGVITNKQALDLIDKIKKLLAEEPDLVRPEDKKFVRNNKSSVQNYLQYTDMLEWAGLGFGSDMNIMIQKSLNRLAKMSGAQQVKLFGKFLCQNNDYWVAQGILNEPEESPRNPQQEARGKGANATVFWVTHNIIGDWIQLPDVEPEQVNASKYIKRILSGDLNAEIDAFPPFPGKERNLLRALIARIQHNTQLCPKGLFEIDEETNDLKIAEEAPSMGVDDLKSLENWAHFYPLLLKAGRCDHYIPPDKSEEEAEELKGKLAEEDPTADRFRAVQEDTPVASYGQCWLSKVCGDAQQYNKIGGDGTQSYGINVIQSLRWPGAYTIAQNGNYCNIYIGDGIKRGDNQFIPSNPPEVMADPVEKEN